MNYDNNANRIRKQLLIRIARLALQDRLLDEIDRLPAKLFPRHKSGLRCCVYKDRAITKYRLMAILGHAIENESDELKPLRQYAQEALNRDKIANPILTVLDEACSACLKARHFVTNVCRGCVARPCVINCPKDAIQIVDGQARIDSDECVDCGKCLKVCPYHAIVHVPIPCENACPVDAISKDEYGREHIDYDKCIFCGKCMTACPFGAIMERSQIIDVITKIKQGKNVIAMLAPAMAGQFPEDFRKVAAAVKKIGFTQVVEVAFGAERTAEHEAQELAHAIKSDQKFMTSSCCPAYVQAMKKHMPEIAPFVSTTPTPMHYAAEWVRQEHADAVTVFIGPCVAKREEALHDSTVDHVLTTEELGALLVAADIEIADCEPLAFARPANAEARGFAVLGGVTNAVLAQGTTDAVKATTIDGLDKKSIRLLQCYAKGKCDFNFIEVMCCEGGCVGGPCNISTTKSAGRRVTDFVRNTKEHAGDSPYNPAG